jgi:hypothetical protein
MPSPYTPPDVLVTQKVRTVVSNNSLPQLPLVVMGPARQLIRRANAGTYTAGDAFSAVLPELAAGAVVEADTVQVLLDAVSDAGRKLGLFQLTLPDDAQLASGDTTIEVDSDIALAYSLLSARNNNQPDSITDDDSASGIPEGIVFTDDSIDFLSLGASVDDTDVVVSAPASIAGTYRIYELVGSGTAVHVVKVEKLSEVSSGTRALDLTFTITGYTNVNGTALINGTDTDATNGDVGVVDTLYSIVAGDYPPLGGFNTPDADSADQVTITMPGAQATNVYTAFNGLVAAASVGDYLRIAGDDTAAANGDFKIVALDITAHTLTVIRVGQTSTGTAAATGGGSATMKLLSVLKGASDDTNAAGDFVTMTVGGLDVDIEVDYAEPDVIHLVSTVTGLTGSTDVTMRRGLPYRSTVATYDLVKRLTSGFSGDVLVSYEASRTDLSLNGLIEITSYQDILDNLGVVHPNNPIALMADMVTRSGLTDGSRTFFALVTDDDTLASYETAIAVLESNEVYFIVPATQEKAILSLLAAHVDAQSEPANKHERVLMGNTAIVTMDQIIPVTGVTWPTDGIVDVDDNKIFASATIDWSLVSAGDMIKILSSGAEDATVVEEHRIVSVDESQNQATCLDDFAATPGDEQIFRIDSFPYTKLQQAEEWRDYAAALADKRVWLIRPDTVEITYTDTLGTRPRDVQVVVPGYYAAAAFAGLMSGLPPQQPMTNVPIPGIDRLFHSNAYFTPDQLNTIAEGGNAILAQTTKSSAPYCREQLSTDMTSLITRTMSITKNVDFASKFVRQSLRPYIGNKNITEEYLTQLRGICESIIRALIAAESMLKGSQLLSLVQSPDQPDTVIVEIALQVPYPANKILVTLFI